MAEPVDTLLQEAIEALRRGERARAKEILTRLIKANQNDSMYWVWMSAAVDTAKERIYCLQTALRLDPDNGAAARGLRIYGALPRDEKIQPFQLKGRRAWEEKLLLAHEKPRESGWQVATSNPVARLAMVLVIGAGLIAAVFYGFGNPRTATFRQGLFQTAGPSPTYSPTPTFANVTPQLTLGPGKPTPLALLVGAFYTPTALYVNTPRPPQSRDIFRAAQAAYQQGNWPEYVREMAQIQQVEPTAADVPFYIGEGYRAQGDCQTALQYYGDALKIDTHFAPGYLGLARARICLDQGADVSQLYNLAIQADPQYGDAYLDRANFALVRKDFGAALPDIQQAARLMPDSALVQLAFAQAYLLKGDDPKALAAAQKANSIDLTLLPSYYYLGDALIANDKYADSIKPLLTYLIYEQADGAAWALLGEAYSKTGDYRAAIDALGKALRYDPNQVQSYIYLGTSYLQLDNLTGAELNFKKAIAFFPNSFEANIGMTQIYYRRGTYGSAYLQAETSKAKATNDTQLALALYWRALSHEGRGDPVDALRDWKALLGMAPGAMTPEMRQAAQDHVKQLSLPSATPTGVTKTPTRTPAGPTMTATRTPTARPGSTATLAPATPSPTLTPKPTATVAPTKTP